MYYNTRCSRVQFHSVNSTMISRNVLSFSSNGGLLGSEDGYLGSEGEDYCKENKHCDRRNLIELFMKTGHKHFQS